MIDNAAMHDSGVEWIGAIPQSWRVDRIKDVIPYITGGGTPSSSNAEYWDDGGISWITPTDFRNSKIPM